MDFKQWIDKFVDKGADPSDVKNIPLGGGSSEDNPYIVLSDKSVLKLDAVMEILAKKYPTTPLSDIDSVIGSQFSFITPVLNSTGSMGNPEYITNIESENVLGNWCYLFTDECAPGCVIRFNDTSGSGYSSIAFDEEITGDSTIAEAMEAITSLSLSSNIFGVEKHENNTFSDEEILSMLEVQE